jgi:hypothetical protein
VGEILHTTEETAKNTLPGHAEIARPVGGYEIEQGFNVSMFQGFKDLETLKLLKL